ncbi:hypothetical protein LO80_08325 [Candidatus Francisella endociliophora]|uniref:PreQ0 transporter n=1 Tax=Candidatus Francisella endociliophora TaxID=653937 RepID=A0A097ER08_9GAMM|nr:VUT family protein [Francisella sp. FSC1006]AIT09972.1 hypothetical protein LO80_08325 [Francisella sp. FSC1006]
MNEQKIKSRYLLIVMLLVTAKLMCNPLFMNRIEFNFFGYDLLITQSAFTYGLVFVMTDLCAAVFGLKQAYIVILLATLMDGLYSFGVYSVSFFAMPENIGENYQAAIHAIHTLSHPTILLFTGGMIASIITYMAEVTLFSMLFKKVFKNNLFWSSVVAIATTILLHNLVLYPIAIDDKANLWKYYWGNFSLDMLFVIIYTFICNLFFRRNQIKES